MTEPTAIQSALIGMGDQSRLGRVFLKDQVNELLRDLIISGRFPPGTKLIEREVSDNLGVSRAPVRDALLQLEKEGLVVTKPNGRYVVELTERDIRELYQVRNALEKLAVELATQNIRREQAVKLQQIMKDMNDAQVRRDWLAFSKSDLETHLLIWHVSGNGHLETYLNSMSGPIFMFVASNAEYLDWNEPLELHQELVDNIIGGNIQQAVQSIQRHLDSALERTLRVLEIHKL
jgi:DNA-binding GntR family transcriptional regulator